MTISDRTEQLELLCAARRDAVLTDTNIVSLMALTGLDREDLVAAVRCVSHAPGMSMLRASEVMIHEARCQGPVFSMDRTVSEISAALQDDYCMNLSMVAIEHAERREFRAAAECQLQLIDALTLDHAWMKPHLAKTAADWFELAVEPVRAKDIRNAAQ